ncbi:MAG: STAS domain-containing protein [Sulfuricella sp.]|nr:STAS domain-containing protein [Sulfuricella sp.]
MMTINIKQDGDTAVLALNGRFDFSIHGDFKNARDEVLQIKGIKEVTVDLTNVQYMDSSALGMLLILRENANLSNLRVSLRSTEGFVQQVLRVANFQNIFTILPESGSAGICG